MRCLCLALAGQGAGGRLSLALIRLITGRIISINLRVGRIVAGIAAGGFTPRRVAARRRPTVRQKRRPSALPTRSGWLLPLLPDAASFRSQLEHLFRDPEMAALLAAAPEALRRPLRSLCWMLWLAPPPILARRQPAAPGPAPLDPTPPEPAPRRPAAPKAAPPLSAGDQPAPRRRARPRVCGPPLPA